MSLGILEKITFIWLQVYEFLSPTRFFNRKYLEYEHINFSDHHIFSDKDIEKIKVKSNGRMVLTTKKTMCDCPNNSTLNSCSISPLRWKF